MPDRVASRIAVAFAAIGLVAALAVGGGLFVSLRSLHRHASLATLADVAQPVAARVRQLGALADLGHELSVTAPGLRAEIGVYEIVNGRVVTVRASRLAVDVSGVTVDPSLTPGETSTGELPAAGGNRVMTSVTLVRADSAAAGPVAILLTLPDTSASLALRDLLQVLPVVALVTAAIAVPIAWWLARSITRPLGRLAAATAALPGTPAAPVPPEGPLEVRELTNRFNATSAELERIRTEERDLLAGIRHDLRTPLTVVLGFAEALRDGTATGPGVGRAGDAIAQEAARMERLVDDLRSIDELQSGRVAMRPEPLDPAAMVEDTVARFAPQAEAAGITLATGADPGLQLLADRGAVERVLGNLVANALAFTRPGGHVVVEARAAGAPSTGAAVAGAPVATAPAGAPAASAHAGPAPAPGGDPAPGPWVALRVSDDGPGFPAGSLDRVFDRFYRADAARAGGGSGLGLSIVRAFAEAHGGRAVAENLAPTGARVTVLLPPIPAGQPASPAATPPAEPPPGDPRRASRTW